MSTVKSLLSVMTQYFNRSAVERHRRSKPYHVSSRPSRVRPVLEMLEDRCVLSPTMTLDGAAQVSEGSPYSLTLGQVVDPNPLSIRGC